MAKRRFRAVARAAPGRSKANRTEARWAHNLEMRKLAGELVWVGFEPIRLRLGADCFYTPDFAWIDDAGLFGFDEVKGGGGWVHEDGRIKWKWAAEQYPFFAFRGCVYGKDKRWRIEEYDPVRPFPEEPRCD